jgi:hypothetical protein
MKSPSGKTAATESVRTLWHASDKCGGEKSGANKQTASHGFCLISKCGSTHYCFAGTGVSGRPNGICLVDAAVCGVKAVLFGSLPSGAVAGVVEI